MPGNKSLGEILVEKKLIDPEDLQHALRIQTGGNRRLGYILIQMKLITDEDLLEALSDQSHIPVVDVETGFSPVVRKVLPRYLCRKYSVLPLSLGRNNVLRLAMVNPLDTEAIKDIDQYTGMVVEPVLARQKAIDQGRKAHIPFSIKDFINPFVYSRTAQIASLLALVLLVTVGILLYREAHKAKYGTYSVSGETEIYNNHELMVAIEDGTMISLVGHGPYKKGFYSVVFKHPDKLKVFIDENRDKFTDPQYDWLSWLATKRLVR